MTTERDAHEIAAPVVPDPSDGRDLPFVADDTSAPLPTSVGVDEYRRLVGETWHQRGLECTGFALAAIANHAIRGHLGDPDHPSVSRRMLYEMAQLHDGESYVEGSTLRGALKGWHRMGVARDDLWPYHPGDEHGAVHGRLTLARLLDGRTRRLSSYRRIAGGEVNDMQRALAEGHVLFACADYHVGWFRLFLPGVDAVIERRPDDVVKGGHAFVVAGYDERGFWIHNSFGPEWGNEGFALLPYPDWEANRHDVWVTEIELVDDAPAGADPSATEVADTATYRDLWPHLVVLRDDGTLSSSGLYEMDDGSVGTLLYLFQERTSDWAHRRLAVFADGGDGSTAHTLERLRPLRDLLMAHEIYPIFVVWETGWWAHLEHELGHWLRRVTSDVGVGGDPDRPGGPTDADVRAALERSVVTPMWDLVVERSREACRRRDGGARFLAEAVAYKRNQIPFDLHLVSHGAGDLLLGELARLLPPPITTATALVPTTTVAACRTTYGALLDDDLLAHLTVVTLDAAAESADRTGPVDATLVRLVGQVLAGLHDPVPPMLGLVADLERDEWIARLRAAGRLDAVHVSGRTHVDLAGDPDLHRTLVERLLAQPTVPVAAPGPVAPAAPSLPRDPLAAAEARRAAGRRR